MKCCPAHSPHPFLKICLEVQPHRRKGGCTLWIDLDLSLTCSYEINLKKWVYLPCNSKFLLFKSSYLWIIYKFILKWNIWYLITSTSDSVEFFLVDAFMLMLENGIYQNNWENISLVQFLVDYALALLFVSYVNCRFEFYLSIKNYSFFIF